MRKYIRKQLNQLLDIDVLQHENQLLRRELQEAKQILLQKEAELQELHSKNNSVSTLLDWVDEHLETEEVLPSPKMMSLYPTLCSKEDCDAPAALDGKCWMHYEAFWSSCAFVQRTDESLL